MEKIGYIDKSNLILTSGLNSIDRLKDIEIQYGYRDIIEDRIDVVQPVCAGVIITKDNQILIINKSSKSTGKISPEKNKTLLYIGGHLDICDNSNSNIQSFTHGMKREIIEEIELTIQDSQICTPIVVYTPTNEKSERHLGIIFPVFIENSFDTAFTDGKCKFISIDNLNKIKNFESWSNIIFKEIIQKISTFQK